MFRKKPTLTREQSLAARPVRSVTAQLAPTATGGGRLTVALESPRWGRWLFRFPQGAKKTFELDSVGVFVWNCCDGKLAVSQIIRRLAERYKLNLREAEVSSIQFLQMLARKGLIGLQIEENQ